LKIGIESMRRLSREAQYLPFEGRLRFLVVDQAEKMTEEAANSILKTLEEPPETTRIILISAYPQRLLPTILSRCQSFPFHGLSRDEIVEHLRERTELPEPELRASFAEGSLGKAIALDLEDTLTKRDRILGFLENWLESPGFERVFEFCEGKPLREELKQREETRRYLDLLQSLCYDVYFLSIGEEERVVSRDCVESLRRLSQLLSLEQIRELLYHVSEAQRDVDRYVSPLVCFETMWLGLSPMEMKDA
jgi:DNA polymerase-3 subunit delta'